MTELERPVRVERERAPCDSDEHVFRPEVYDASADDAWIDVDDECCTVCGWSWADILEHEAGLCCCPASHGTRRAE